MGFFIVVVGAVNDIRFLGSINLLAGLPHVKIGFNEYWFFLQNDAIDIDTSRRDSRDPCLSHLSLHGRFPGIQGVGKKVCNLKWPTEMGRFCN